jgi:exopolysaccharide biosynthesis polyprenyl glycosylphosphotransferase
VPTEAPSRPPASAAGAAGSDDVRSSRVYLLSRGPVVGLLRRALSVGALILADVAGLALGVYAALVLRALLYGDTIYWSILWETGPAEWLPFLAPVTVLVFLQSGLYAPRERRAGAGKVLGALVLVALIVLAFGIGTDYDFSTTGLIPTAVVTSALAIGALRAAYGSIALELLRVLGARRRLVLVGEGETLSDLERQLRAARWGIEIEVVETVSDVRRPESLERLAALLEAERPDELVLAEADFDEETVLGVVQLAHRHGVKVKLAPSTTEILVHEGEYVPGQGVPLFELRPPLLSGVAWVTKRVFDLVVAFLLVVLGLPFWLLLAAAIKLDSRGPVLYVDRRIGVGEREFGMLKFRTMVADAAEQQDELEEENEASGALFKIRQDPRVTRVGRVLRRLSLDELPQLVNVLRGQMSLVGPRPLPLRDHAMLADWHRARYLVLPGMTGLWQISGRSGLEFDDLVRLDFTYIENWSIWSDVSIIARTIPAVLTGRGAY